MKFDNTLKGTFGQEIVKTILEVSGYTVCSYGYEKTLVDAKSKYSFKKYNSPTGHRLTHSPDLLVYDKEDVIMLVEVKTRGKKFKIQGGLVWINSSELSVLKEFWNECILVLLLPEGIFAQRISDLEIQKNDLQRLSDFKKFNEIFTRCDPLTILHYEEIALQMLEIFMNEKEKKALEDINSESPLVRTLKLTQKQTIRKESPSEKQGDPRSIEN